MSCTEVAVNQKMDVSRTLDFLFPENEVFEMCALNVKENKTDVYKWTAMNYPMGGWFQNKDTAIDYALKLDQQAYADAIYVTLNPCPSDLLARVNERIKELQNRTADVDVKHYRNFLIDIDPIRKTKISSSDDEHDYALDCAKTIINDLSERGWSEPMYCDSGNGAHLIYKVDLDVSPESIDLLKRCLQALSQKYSNNKVDIDEKVFNPARITKLYVTHARKGDGSDERPHRLSRIISIPDNPKIVSRELLEALAADYVELEPAKKESQKLEAKSISSNKVDASFHSQNGLDVKAYLEAHGIKISNIKQEKSSTFYCLDPCVFDPSHSTNEASIIQNTDGSLRYQCFHNSCADKTWEDARTVISGDEKLTPFLPVDNRNYKPSKYKHRIQPVMYNVQDLMKEELPEIKWIVENLIPTGLCMIVGKPKMGKSFFSLQLAIAVSNGTPFLDQYPSTKGRVLFLGLEDQKRRLKDRIEKLGGTGTQNIDIYFDYNSLNNGGLDDLQNYIDHHEDVKLIVIDTFGCFRFGHQQTKDMYQLDYDQMNQIKRIADQNDVAIMLVHHLRKTVSEDPFDQISGSTGIFGSLDTAIILTKSRTNGDSNLLITSRDIAGGSYAMTFNEDNCSWSLLGRTEDIVHHEIDQKIIDLLRERGCPLRSVEIEQVVSDESIKAGTVRSRISKMVKREQIIKLDTGLYGLSELINKYNNHNNVTNTTCATDVTTVTTSTTVTGVATVTTVTNQEDNKFVTPCSNQVQQCKSSNNSDLDNSVTAVTFVTGNEENDVQQQSKSVSSNQDYFEDSELLSFDFEDESTHHHPPVPDVEPSCLSDEPQLDDSTPFEDFLCPDVMDEIDEILKSDKVDEEKFDLITTYIEPLTVSATDYLSEEEINYYQNRIANSQDEEPVQEETVDINWN